MIEIKNLGKSYEEKNVLCKISARFEDDSITCVMGESGIGKTTLVKILAGLEKPDGGTVEGTGVVSVCFQEDRLIEDISAADNVLLVLDKNDYGVGKNKLRSQVNENLSEVLKDYDCTKNEKVSTYSGGMKRRVSLVRAMMKKSDTVILDEPFSGMDNETKTVAAEYIKRHRNGRICIVVTHDRSDAQLLGGTIYLLTTDKAVDTI